MNYSFMHILGNMWNRWVSKESLVEAAKRVGVTANGLSVLHAER